MITNKYGKDEDIKNELIYWLKQWYKIWEYIQRIHLYEILKMRIQFVKDDDGKVWLNYAKDIVVRKIKFDQERHYIMKEVQMINDQAKVDLVQEINNHIDTTWSIKSIHSIYTVMNKHYTTMKDKIGVTQWLEEESEEDEDDWITQDAFKSLRPSSPYTLKEVINKEKFTPKKFIKQK